MIRILQERDIQINQLRPGDIIHFFYKGRERKLYVLNPNWQRKLHGLYIDNLPISVILRMSDLIKLKPPYNFYHTYIKIQNLTVPVADIYRTFFVAELLKPKIIFYDLGYSEINPNTVRMAGNSVLLGMNDSRVYISEYPMYQNYLRWIAINGMFIREAPLPSAVTQFASDINAPQRFNTWKIPGVSDTDERQIDFLNRLLARNAIFFVKDTDWGDFGYEPTVHISPIR